MAFGFGTNSGMQYTNYNRGNNPNSYRSNSMYQQQGQNMQGMQKQQPSAFGTRQSFQQGFRQGVQANMQIPNQNMQTNMGVQRQGMQANMQMPSQGMTPNMQMPSQGMPVNMGIPTGAPQSGTPVPQGPLPDGVTFQPIDEKTFNELKNSSSGIAHSPIANGSAPVVETGGNKNFSARLEEFIQNERNASVFYKSLADKALEIRNKNILDELSKNSKKMHESFNKIYTQHRGEQFIPVESEIDTLISFNEGVSLAIYEESKALRTLSEIYENMPDQQIGLALNHQICKKISDLNFLHLIKRS